LRLAVLDALRVRDVVALPRELVVLAFPRARDVLALPRELLDDDRLRLDVLDDALPRVRDVVALPRELLVLAFPRARDVVDALPRVRDVLAFPRVVLLFDLADAFGFVLDPFLAAGGTFALPGSLARTFSDGLRVGYNAAPLSPSPGTHVTIRTENRFRELTDRSVRR
jgi:hypothetical protein